MPTRTVVDMPQEEQAQMPAALRRARDGYWLALQMLLWCAAGRTPTDIAAVLCCSRSSVYRTVRASRAGTLGLVPDDDGRLSPPVRTTVLVPTLRRSLLALLKAPPRTYDWCRTRWSGATLAATFKATHGLTVSAETMRRWVHEGGWGWKRANLVANDDDPHRVERLARISFVYELLQRWEAIVFTDELAIHLLPNVGYAWMPQGPQVEVMTPGTNEQHDLDGVLDLTASTLHPCVGPRNTNGLFRTLLHTREDANPVRQYQRLDDVVDHDRIPTAEAVEQW